MTKATFLGPIGTTFSHEAYRRLQETYSTPAPACEFLDLIPVYANREVIPAVIAHGGYGALAMETKAEGRVAEPLESFIELLGKYKTSKACPIGVIGAIQMELNFCLMTKREGTLEDIKVVYGHERALGACARHLEALGVETNAVGSNGMAACHVRDSEAQAGIAALAPRQAALKYDLAVLEEAVEDEQAATTFFLLGPRSHEVARGEKNRALLVCELEHQPGALVDALIPLKEEELNLIQIHSVHAGNGTYRFALEVEVPSAKLDAFERAMGRILSVCTAHILFGPFMVS